MDTGDRLIIFTNWSHNMTRPLLEGLCYALAETPELQVAAICDTYPTRPRPFFLKVLRRAIVRLYNPDIPLAPISLSRRKWIRLAQQLRCDLLVPPRRDLNDPGFVERLGTTYRPTLGLALYCTQRLGPALLSQFDVAVNYHNGTLPAYEGAQATAWSVYRGERYTGYTFHRMAETPDPGSVLAEGRISTAESADVIDLDVRKAIQAAAHLPAVLRAMRAREPGRPATGTGRYYSTQDLQMIRTIDEPWLYTRREIERRLHAFTFLHLRRGARWYEVTRFREGAGRHRLSIRTADGHVLRPYRFLYMPLALYAGFKKLEGLFGDQRRTIPRTPAP